MSLASSLPSVARLAMLLESRCTLTTHRSCEPGMSIRAQANPRFPTVESAHRPLLLIG